MIYMVGTKNQWFHMTERESASPDLTEASSRPKSRIELRLRLVERVQPIPTDSTPAVGARVSILNNMFFSLLLQKQLQKSIVHKYAFGVSSF